MAKRGVVIVAGGSGSRMQSALPKQFLMLAGKYVLEHSVDTFCAHPMIDEVTIVVSEAYLERVQNLAGERNWKKVMHIVAGGKERYHSTLAAVEAYKEAKSAITPHWRQ